MEAIRKLLAPLHHKFRLEKCDLIFPYSLVVYPSLESSS
jgi:hypothetical protein